MTDYIAKKVILKDRRGNYLIPYIDGVDSAEKDGNGNVIANTYATKAELNQKQPTGSYVTGYNKGSSTVPIYINSAGVATVCGSSLAVSVTGSSGSCTGNAATSTKATQDASGNVITSYYLNKKESSIHQTQATTTATISLADKTCCYNITPSAATTFTFNTSGLSTTGTVITFELKIVMSTVYTMTFPSTVKWLNNETPDLSKTGTYLLTFRTYDGGTSWVGCLEGSF